MKTRTARRSTKSTRLPTAPTRVSSTADPEATAEASVNRAMAFGKAAADRHHTRDPATDGYKPGSDEYEAWLVAYDQAWESFEAMQARVDEEPEPARKPSLSKAAQAWKKATDRNGTPAGSHDSASAAEVTAFREQFEHLQPGDEYAKLNVAQIEDTGNPRTVFRDIESLAASILDVGLLQPLVVQRKPSNPERYLLIGGGRRLRAAIMAGLTFVPCYVRQQLSDADRAIARLVENFDRADLTPIEQAQGFRDACKPISEGGAGLTQTKLAERLRVTQGHISNMLRLLELPECWHDYLADGRMSVSAARDGLLKYSKRVGQDVLRNAEKCLQAMPWAKAPFEANALEHAVYNALPNHARRFIAGEALQTRSLSKEESEQLHLVEILGTTFATVGDGAGHRASELEKLGIKAMNRVRGHYTVPGILEAVYKTTTNPAEIARTAVTAWLGHSFEGSRPDVAASDIELLAQALDIDLQKEWRCEEAFLQLLTTDQLREVASEWKQSLPQGTRSGLIKLILMHHGGKARCPKLLASVKPVDLN